MDIEALKWYRENSDFTENSNKVGNKPIVYPSHPLLGNVYLDVIKSDGLLYFGTPGEYGAENKASKYISVVSSPDKGKVFYTDYKPNKNITKNEVFPGGNFKLDNNTSPYHMIKLYFPGRTSLALNKNQKIWG